MPHAPLRACPCRPNCPERIPRGQRFCAEGQKRRDAARPNADFRRLYFTARWRQLRAAQLEQSPACEDCAAAGKLEPATDVHHRHKPRSVSEFFDASGLGSLCHRCHSTRTQRGE